MTALEQVTELKKQGMSDEEIASNLRQQGFSPKEITDAINQANIKTAVTGNEGNVAAQTPETPSESSAEDTEVVEGSYAPATEEVAPSETPAEYSPEYQAQAPAIDTTTMIEIANQVFSEKSEKIQKQIDSLNEFKTLTETKVNSINERLKRIEKIIDTLQIKILEKVSLFGRSIESTKKEVSMLEDTLGKLTKTTKETSKQKK